MKRMQTYKDAQFTKKEIYIFFCIMGIMAGLIILLIVKSMNYTMIEYNNNQLKKSITETTEEIVSLNDIIPFEYDTIYTIDPYMQQEDIEKLIGFESNSIKVNNINEGLIHLIIVKDKIVIASVLAYQDNVGYTINLKDTFRSYDENVKLKVERNNNIVELTYMEE